MLCMLAAAEMDHFSYLGYVMIRTTVMGLKQSNGCVRLQNPQIATRNPYASTSVIKAPLSSAS